MSPGSRARKVVTVLFSDVSGSTALGEELDPESLRQIMSRYFEEAKHVLSRHGGTVEKFIGDAVVAVFGVPLTHEDDALRAVRAGVELREALDRLNEDFHRSWGVTVVDTDGHQHRRGDRRRSDRRRRVRDRRHRQSGGAPRAVGDAPARS